MIFIKVCLIVLPSNIWLCIIRRRLVRLLSRAAPLNYLGRVSWFWLGYSAILNIGRTVLINRLK